MTAISADVDGSEVHEIRENHQLLSVRAAALLRLAVVGLMAGAMVLGTHTHEWFAQSVLVASYGAGAIWVAVLAFRQPIRPPRRSSRSSTSPRSASSNCCRTVDTHRWR